MKQPRHPGFSPSGPSPSVWTCRRCGMEVITIQEGKRHVRVCGRKKFTQTPIIRSPK